MRRFAAVVIVACFPASSCRHAPQAVPPPSTVSGHTPIARPNVLLVVVDTLRYDAITGANAKSAPFLTALGASSTTFTNAYSTNDSTPGSHFSLMSGFVAGWQTTLDDTRLGLPEQLARAGYDTFGVAANGILTPALLRVLAGFRRYSCLYDEWEKMSPEQHGPFMPEITARLSAYHARDNDWNEVMLYASASRVVARVKENLASVRQPFFGFVNFIEPHDPYLPLVPPPNSEQPASNVDPDLRFRHVPRFMTAPASLPDGPRKQSLERRLQLAEGRAWSLSDDLTPDAIRTYRARYQAEVKEADEAIRKLLVMLDARGLLDSTVVIITSDHGEAFGESGLMTHMFQNGGDPSVLQHVPLFLALPGDNHHDREQIDSIVTSADIAPTIYDLVGVDWRPIARGSWVGNYGKSLLPLLGLPMTASGKTPTYGEPLDEQDLREKRRSAIERLRALGYIR